MILLMVGRVAGHSGHGGAHKDAPIDTLLWLHIAVQVLVWGFIWPMGMVLGLKRNRFHVPLVATGFVLTAAGYLLGHVHRGRGFKHTVHHPTANIYFIFLGCQLSMGIYLKMHIHEETIRPYVVKCHGVLGRTYPILGWVQMVFGAITLQGYCFDNALGQCLAHYLMGGAFVGYGILLAIALLAGASWLRKRGQSQEYYDSWVIMLWGIVNTFTEHRGSHWSHKDMQHTTLGVIWWAGGAFSIWTSRNGQRSIIPALIIIITGWAMSSHEQAIPMSTKVHSIFGIALMSAGVARLIEIAFLLRDQPSPDRFAEGEENKIWSFQHLPPFGLIAAGILFMSATDEEIKFVMSIEMDHVTYALILFSIAFVIYLWSCFLINFASSKPQGQLKISSTSSSGSYRKLPHSRSLSASTTTEFVLDDGYELDDQGEDEIDKLRA
jgi:hypothetical protein